MADPTEDEASAKVMGVPFRIRGMNGINMMLLSLAIGGCMFLLYDRAQRNEAQLEAVSQAHALGRDRQTTQMAQEHAAIVQTMRESQQTSQNLVEAINEQNYLLLADERERSEIKRRLKRPESLTKKLDRNVY
jgi:septal ring factor EnvC (AmiA/AmiB activator)